MRSQTVFPLVQAGCVLSVALIWYMAIHKTDGAPQLPEKPMDVRVRLLKEGGGNAESEAAVSRGLAWLAKQQKEDGSWSFDGSSKDHIAATGMALLPFLAAGEYDFPGLGVADGKGTYKKQVAAGVDWLVSKVGDRGAFGGTNNMYSHAIATLALCEAAGRSKNPKVKQKAKLAVEYLLGAQGANGSWGYTGPAPSEGDTSIVGWQVQALAAADWAQIPFENKDKVFKKTDEFLESVSTNKGANYGYRERGQSQTLTPVGLLSRSLMGKMATKDAAFASGVEFIKKFPPQKDHYDTYYYYYATRVTFLRGGDDWHKFWNPKMRDMLIELQNKGGDDTKRGSWEKDQGFIGSACGRLGTTALAILTLQVYYRYLPLFKPGGGELNEVDK